MAVASACTASIHPSSVCVGAYSPARDCVGFGSAPAWSLRRFLIPLVLHVSAGIGSGMSMQSRQWGNKGRAEESLDVAVLTSRAPGVEEGSALQLSVGTWD